MHFAVKMEILIKPKKKFKKRKKKKKKKKKRSCPTANYGVGIK